VLTSIRAQRTQGIHKPDSMLSCVTTRQLLHIVVCENGLVLRRLVMIYAAVKFKRAPLYTYCPRDA